MTETVLSLVPDYGLPLIFFVVALACLAVPLPASVLVLTSGSFAAAGDLTLSHVLVVAFAGFVVGDQLAFWIASRAGPHLLARLKRSQHAAPVIERSERMLQERGAIAVFLSHTVLSPTCPYISYLSGAGGLSWQRFTVTAAIGALLWTGAYVALGYVFSAQLEQVAAAASQFFGVILSLSVVAASLILLRRRWRASQVA